MADKGGKGASSMDDWNAESLRCCCLVSNGGQFHLTVLQSRLVSTILPTMAEKCIVDRSPFVLRTSRNRKSSGQ